MLIRALHVKPTRWLPRMKTCNVMQLDSHNIHHVRQNKQFKATSYYSCLHCAMVQGNERSFRENLYTNKVCPNKATRLVPTSTRCAQLQIRTQHIKQHASGSQCNYRTSTFYVDRDRGYGNGCAIPPCRW